MGTKIKLGIIVILVLSCTFFPGSSAVVFARESSPPKIDDRAFTGSVPTLDLFVMELKQINADGIWAENLFAYVTSYGSWGYVPNSENTASYTIYQNYHGFFIHDYLGGDGLYRVQKWTKVAVIQHGEVSWFVITENARYQASSNGAKCYIDAPFYKIENQSLLGGPVTTQNLLDLYYTKPFTIQTCLCSAGINGVQILVGDWTTPPSDGIASLN